MQKLDPTLVFFSTVSFMCGALLFGLPPFNVFSWSTLKEFSVVVGGFIAAVIAIPNVWNIRRQVLKERKAALAALAIHVSVVSRYATECMHLADRYFELTKKRTDPSSEQGDDAPICDPDSVSNLAESAGLLDDEVATKIGDLLATYQVQSARLDSFIRRYRKPQVGHTTHVGLNKEAGQAIRDAARVYLMAGKIFEHAREGRNFRGDLSKEEIDRHIEMELGRSEPVSSW